MPRKKKNQNFKGTTSRVLWKCKLIRSKLGGLNIGMQPISLIVGHSSCELLTGGGNCWDVEEPHNLDRS